MPRRAPLTTMILIIMFFRVEELPVDQIGDAYLLDFVGPPGFVQQLSPKVDRFALLHLLFHCFSPDWFLRICLNILIN